jgi:hypothetical protein
MSDPMPAKAHPHDFIVRLEGLQLDEASRSRIAGAIQGAVMLELGRLDLAGPKRLGGFAHIPIDWLGFWLREATNAQEALKGLGGTLQIVDRANDFDQTILCPSDA